MKILLILLGIVLIGFACTKSEKAVEPVGEMSMKSVSYRGGLVSFSIPSHWKEEYGEGGGGMFYDGSQDSGTLRLNILTFDTSNSSDAVDVSTAAQKTAATNGGEAFALREDDAMARYDSQSFEDGEALTLRFWQVYNRVNDSHLRIAVFSYTLPSASIGGEKHKLELEMLDREIRNARFAETTGTLQ